jgi:hypothetical protein
LRSGFSEDDSDVRDQNVRIELESGRLASTALASRLQRRIGWHLYIETTR